MAGQGIEKLRGELTVAEIRQAILRPYAELLKNLKQVYIFGTKILGQRVCGWCEAAGIEVLGFLDNDEQRQGQFCAGKKIFSPAHFPGGTAALIIVASTTYQYKISQQLRTAGFHNIVSVPILSLFDSRRFPAEAVFKNMQEDLVSKREKYLALYESLADAQSKRVLDGLLAYRLTFDLEFLKPICELQQPEYFDRQVMPLNSEEVFVDAGGFNGDTSLQFLQAVSGHYRRIYFFEPDPGLMAAAKKNLSLAKDIVFFPLGVYSHAASLRFHPTGGLDGALDEQGELEVKTISLDEAVSEPVSLIKMDIEGAENAALAGARRHLKNERPKLALSAYHHPQDLWQLPEAIRNLNPEYRFFLRQYSLNAYETILYAI